MITRQAFRRLLFYNVFRRHILVPGHKGPHMHLVGVHLAQFRDALQDVSEVAQLVFELLRGLVGGPGEEAEGGDVGEVVFVVELAQVAAEGAAVGDDAGRLDHVRGDPQAGGKVVGRAGRDVADRDEGLVGVLHHTADDLIQRAVSAGAHNVEVVPHALPGNAAGISLFGCRVTDHLVVCRRQCLDDIQQMVADLRLTRYRIEDKQDFFPGRDHASVLRDSPSLSAVFRSGRLPAIQPHRLVRLLPAIQPHHMSPSDLAVHRSSGMFLYRIIEQDYRTRASLSQSGQGAGALNFL